MQALTKSDEQKLFDGVKKASTLVDKESMSPNDALHKVAVELQYSPGFLKKACHAFNTGRQLAQWEANENALDKLASFPLADYDVVHDRIWGQTQEKAASVNYGFIPLPSYDALAKNDLLSLPVLEKSAEVKTEVAYSSTRSYDHYKYAELLESNARTEKTAAELKFNSAINALISYFQKSAYDRLPFAQVEYAVGVEYGNAGKALMNTLAEVFPKEKRASAYRVTDNIFSQSIDINSAPYTLVEQAIKSASVLNNAISSLAEAQEKTAKHRDSLDALYLSINPEIKQEVFTDNLLDKQASLLDATALLTMDSLRKSNVKLPSQQEDVAKMKNKLEDPEHNNELRKIKAQTALHSLMTDPENPISEYDPEDVLNAYNELTQISPRIADKPAILTPMLNKRLAGRMEPFELGEALKLELGLKQTESPKMPTQQNSSSNNNLMAF